MATTTTIRSWWAPACQGPFTRVALYGNGVVSIDPKIVEATHALSACLEAYSYETRAADTGAYNCRIITGGTGYSLHAYGIALDINWLSNPYGPTLKTDMPPAMTATIKAIRTRNGKTVWRWGGDYAGNKDAMHFEVVCHPSDLATGINPATVPGSKPVTKPPVKRKAPKMASLIVRRTNQKQALFECGDTLYVAHNGAVTTEGPKFLVNDDVWNDLIATHPVKD